MKARVEKSGHDVSEEDQRRWPRTLANMKQLLPSADLAVLLDNSGSAGYVLVGFGHKITCIGMSHCRSGRLFSERAT